MTNKNEAKEPLRGLGTTTGSLGTTIASIAFFFPNLGRHIVARVKGRQYFHLFPLLDFNFSSF